MTIQVRLFAGLREAAGAGELALELPEGATVADAWALLAERYPALASASGLNFAVNRGYAQPTQALSGGDELALIPPVSGG